MYECGPNFRFMVSNCIFWTHWHVYEVHNMSGLSDSCSWNDNLGGTWLAKRSKIISAVQMQDQLCYLSIIWNFHFWGFLTFWGGLNSNYLNNKDVVMIRGQMRYIFSHMFILGQIILFCLTKYFYITIVTITF